MLMLSKCYKSTEVDRRTWLHVRQGLSGPPAVTLTKWVKWLKYKKRDKDVYTILNRISLTIWTIWAFRVQNPLQWFLAKQSSLKRWKEISQ